MWTAWRSLMILSYKEKKNKYYTVEQTQYFNIIYLEVFWSGGGALKDFETDNIVPLTGFKTYTLLFMHNLDEIKCLYMYTVLRLMAENHYCIFKLTVEF